MLDRLVVSHFFPGSIMQTIRAGYIQMIHRQHPSPDHTGQINYDLEVYLPILLV